MHSATPEVERTFTSLVLFVNYRDNTEINTNTDKTVS